MNQNKKTNGAGKRSRLLKLRTHLVSVKREIGKVDMYRVELVANRDATLVQIAALENSAEVEETNTDPED